MIKRITPIIIVFLIALVPYNSVYGQEEVENPVYIVQAGENLTQIAQKFGLNVQELISANNILDANLISEGTQLIIPNIIGISGILETVPISFGDSYRSLLEKNGLSEENFQLLNKITSPSELYVGSEIIAPTNLNAERLNNVVVRTDDSLFSVSIRANENPWFIRAHSHGNKIISYGRTIFYPSTNSDILETTISDNISQIEISPLPFTQGHTIGVYIYANANGLINGRLGEEELIFFFDETNAYYYSLHGVHALDPIGLVELMIGGEFGDDEVFSAIQMVLINSGGYRQESITVEQTKIDQDLNFQESEFVDQIVSQSSPDKRWDGSFRYPVDGSTSDETIGFTSYFGNRRSYNNGQYFGFHGGLDFEVRLMSLNIYAPAAGIVAFAGPMEIRGNTLFIDHGQGVFSGYAHLNQFFVNAGDKVESGQIIGEIGQTGRVTGPHLHWDVWVNGNQVDPFDWINNSYP